MKTAAAYALLFRDRWSAERRLERTESSDDDVVRDALATLRLARFPRKG